MSKNVFLDLGFEEEEAAGLELRSQLFIALQEVIRRSGKTQKEIAAIIGTDQPKISRIVNGKFGEFSTERIALYLEKLGYQIELRVFRNSSTAKKKKTKVSKSA